MPLASTRLRVWLLAGVAAGAGVLDLASAMDSGVFTRLVAVRDVLTPGVANLAAGIVALLGLTLLLVSRGLLGRRRLAMQVAVVALLASTVVHGVRGGGLAAAAVTLTLAVLLWHQRRLFTVEPGPARLRRAAGTLVLLAALAFGYGMVGLVVHERISHGQPGASLSSLAAEVADRLIGQPGPLRMAGRFGHWFPTSLTFVGIGALLAGLAYLLAPVAERAAAAASERAEVRRLMQRPDGDTLDPFALRGDKRYVFSADRRAAIGYRYLNGVGLASGDPVGAPESFPDAVRGFLEACDRRGWRPAMVGVRGDRLPLYRQLGLRTFYVGDEAVVDVDRFSLDGRVMRNVRQAANRANNFGVRVELHREGDLPEGLRLTLLDIAAADRGRAPERGFSMALDGLLSGRDADCLVVVCRSAHGHPVALQRYVPCRDGRALSLDAMRRTPGAPNGVNERMIVEVLRWAPTHGVTEVSLNFSAFRRVLDRDVPAGRVRATEAWLLRTFDPLFQLDSLYRFNAKFRPRWVPRYAVYRSRGELPAVGLAALSAESYLPFARRTTVDVTGAEQTEPTASGRPH